MAKKQKKRWTHTVSELSNKLPINIISAQVFPILGSKSSANKAIEGKRLFLNGRPAVISDMVQNGDRIELRGSGVKKIKKLDLDLPVVFEDDHIIVINKPGGIAVNGNRNKTVENALADKNYNNNTSEQRPLVRRDHVLVFHGGLCRQVKLYLAF